MILKLNILIESGGTLEIEGKSLAKIRRHAIESHIKGNISRSMRCVPITEFCMNGLHGIHSLDESNKIMFKKSKTEKSV